MATMETDKPPDRTRRRFCKVFKADAGGVGFGRGATIAAVARDLGIGETNLGNWVRDA